MLALRADLVDISRQPDESTAQRRFVRGRREIMLRLTAIFIAICVVLIAASLGAVGYLVFGLTVAEASIVALTAMTALALYNTVTSRLRDRNDVGDQITDLSRGTADLARQVAELGRRVIAVEHQEAARRTRSANDPLASEIGELGVLIKQLAETVATHDARFADLQAVPVALAPAPIESPRLAPAASPPLPAEPVKSEPAKSDATRPEPVMSEPAVFSPIALEPAAVEAPPAPPELPATGPLKGKSADEIVAILKSAIDNNRIDLYLQPVVTLPQRKVRYYEAMTRLRTEDGTLILPSDFLAHAEKSGLIPRIDNVQLFRCVQVLRRLLLKIREIGLFCNVSVQTLNDPDVYRQFSEFLEANRALSSSLMLEFTQSALRDIGPLEQESLASLIALGFRFSMDHVTDLRIGPRDLSDLGVRFVKIPAALLLSKAGAAADIHAADLSDLLGRHGVSLIAERIEAEASVVDLLDYDVRFGQGFLFSPPRPVRAEALQGTVAEAARPASEPLGLAARAAI
jgi:cyclic-di-GMP phosphodiesterase TipF (flagellum assembly factor)